MFCAGAFRIAASRIGVAAFIKQRQAQREHEKRRAEDGGGPGEQIGGAAAGHEVAHALAAAEAEPAAFAALDHHHADERDGDEDMQHEKNFDHRNPGTNCCVGF